MAGVLSKRRNYGWLLVCAGISFGLPLAAGADEQAELYFENHVRPILVERCSRCHGSEKQTSGLRVDSREALLRGGDSGPALVAGDPAASLIMQAVRREDGLEMPPDDPLLREEIEALRQWIQQGAPWPASPPTGNPQSQAATHWAFQPVVAPPVPMRADAWVRSPIDAFVLRQLESAGLAPAPPADRRTLIRRATVAVTGLLPSPEETAAFVDDTTPDAYERLIDRLLDSPQYGEHWARLWLDVARYSDTKGYVYAREERFWVHAWTYRDWVVQALNEDMPYDRFLLLQLAADQVPDRREVDLAAMGFLTLGRRFLGVPHLIIDDRIDVITRGTMGLTVACARCHDHKYDPITAADYYALYGVLDSCSERLARLNRPSSDEAFEQELSNRQDKLQAELAAAQAESSARVRDRIADYLHAQTELHKYPAQGFDQVFTKSDLLPAFVHRWEDYLRNGRQSGDPVFSAWHAYADIPEDSFAEDAVTVTRQLQQRPDSAQNPLVAKAFIDPPQSFDEVIRRYARLFNDLHQRWKSQQESDDQGEPPSVDTFNPAERQLLGVLVGPDAPCQVPIEPIVHSEAFFDSDTCTNLWKLQGEVDRWLIQSNGQAPHALVLADRPTPSRPWIFRRGDPLRKTTEVPRRFLSVLAGEDAEPFQTGSGRLELAQAIIDPSNPLTARVVVNRVWARYFGQGLVDTPSDFGLRADPPSHPQLLDWLANQLVSEGWSLKELQRTILLSATFQQDSSGPADPQTRARAVRQDPANRLLWQVNPRRLSFEEFRDALLAASGQLDLKPGGKPAPLFETPYPRVRTLYGRVDRQFLPGTLRIFDFANPDLHIPQRSETTVPQQALFFMNHPLVLEQARALADVSASETEAAARVRWLFQRVYQREPSDMELSEAISFVDQAQVAEAPRLPATVADWSYGYSWLDESAQRVAGFTPLPYFSGTAHQGGPNWPDAQLGWVQLTADGGHPGNDRQHASVRRWTAPRTMTIQLRSQLIHEPAAGDGIRAFIVSSRGGVLGSASIHQKTIDLDVPSLLVEAGETIDLVVDIGDVLNSDQYLWEVTIQDIQNDDPATRWNSKGDFTTTAVEQLDAWQQLAQVLLCSNEFLFVD